MRSGPGRISVVRVGEWPLLKITARVWRSSVGSPFTSMKWAECVTGSNTITKSAGSVQRHLRLLAGRKLDRVDGELAPACSSKAGLGQIEAGAPEDLPEVFPHRQRLRIVRRDPPHARAHGEGDLDHLVQRRLVGARAERAVVGFLVHRLELLAGVEHPAAARAQHVPVQLEQADPRGMQEAADGLFLVEAAVGREISALTRQSARSSPSRTSASMASTDRGIGGTAERAEQSLDLAWDWASFMTRKLSQKTRAASGRPAQIPAKERDRTVKSAVPVMAGGYSSL